MTSKEALKRIKDDIEINYLTTKHNNEKDKYNYLELLKIIEKDLKLLEVLEKYIYSHDSDTLLHYLKYDEVVENKMYKQIEEENGIDLITLFKAQQGIWVKRNNGFYFFDNLIIDLKCKCLVQIVSNDEVETFPFDAYGEDWALSREELK